MSRTPEFQVQTQTSPILANKNKVKPVRLFLPRPHPKQGELINAFELNPGVRFVVGACGTKFGKTYGCVIRLVTEAWNNKGSINWWVAQTYESATMAMALAKRFLPVGMYQEKTAEHKIILYEPNGEIHSEIHFKSGDNPDSLRGFAVNFLIMDEAARQPYESFVSVLTTMTQTRGRGIFISTPKGHNWFYDVYQRGEKFTRSGAPKFPEGVEDPFAEWMAIRMPTWCNPTVPPESILDMKKNLPADVFTQEVGAEFMDGSAGVFNNIQGCIKGTDFEQPIPGHLYVVGVDLARLRDFSVLTVMDRQRRHVVHMERFNQVEWEVQYQRILACAKRFNNAVCCIDSTGIGDPIVQTLRGGGLAIEPYKIGSSTAKQQLIEKLRVNMENGRISYPVNEKKPNHNMSMLLHELDKYEYVIGATGTVRYSAPSGQHDDCVISLALANWVCDQEIWKYRSFNRRGI